MSGEGSAIITSLCWVSRGYAKAVLEEYEPSKKELETYKKIESKLTK
jgi:hypothetical protein